MSAAAQALKVTMAMIAFGAMTKVARGAKAKKDPKPPADQQEPADPPTSVSPPTSAPGDGRKQPFPIRTGKTT